MINQRLVSGFLVLLLLVSFAPSVLAEEGLFKESSYLDSSTIEAELEEVKAGTVPGSAFYGLDKALDSISYALARNKETRGLKIAQERLLELKTLKESGSEGDIQEARVEHEEMVERVRLRIKQRLEGEGDEDDFIIAIRFEKALAIQEEQIDDLRGQLESLSSAQRAILLGELILIQGKLGEVRIDIENEQHANLGKLEVKLGKSRAEIETEFLKLKMDKKIKVEILGNRNSVVRISYFNKRRTDSTEDISVESLLEDALENLKTGVDEARQYAKFSEEDDNYGKEEFVKLKDAQVKKANEIKEKLELEKKESLSFTGKVTQEVDEEETEIEYEEEVGEGEDGFKKKVKEELKYKVKKEFKKEVKYKYFGEGYQDDRLDVKIDYEVKKDGDQRGMVHVRFRFVVESIDKETIFRAIADETNSLTIEDLENSARIKEKNHQITGKNRKVEIKIFEKNGDVYSWIRVYWEGLKEEFKLKTSDKDEIIAEVALRLGVTEEEVLAAIKKFEKKDMDSEPEEVDGDEDDYSDAASEETDDGGDSGTDGGEGESEEVDEEDNSGSGSGSDGGDGGSQGEVEEEEVEEDNSGSGSDGGDGDSSGSGSGDDELA